MSHHRGERASRPHELARGGAVEDELSSSLGADAAEEDAGGESSHDVP